jgi:hypothetical protein
LKIIIILHSLILITGLTRTSAKGDQDYQKYHRQINEAEILISTGQFGEALNVYEQVFNNYDFVFLRDYKNAAHLAHHLKKTDKTYKYLKEGIAAGWDLKSLKKNKYLSQLHDDPEWDILKAAYPDLRNEYLQKIENDTREEVRKMFKKDQWKALGALFRIGDKAQEKYALKKFAPHSEIQIKKLIKILEKSGYPGEKLIGNNFWMSTILSHHNSITQEYVQKDTLYNFIKPMLKTAVRKGQMSPYEFALIDDWYVAVSSNRIEPGYGFLNQPNESTLNETNQLREGIGLRTIELRNKLVDVEKRTGMNLNLPDWIHEKIEVEPD